VGYHYGIALAAGVILDIQKVGGHYARVRTVSVEQFGKGYGLRIERCPQGLDLEGMLARAKTLLARRRIPYGLLGWTGFNCEHVARWVQTGKWSSLQANDGNALLLGIAISVALLRVAR